MMDLDKQPRLLWWPDGTAALDHGMMNERFRQANCAKCGEPIRWSLDMMSFDTGAWPQKLCHARCVWLKEAFQKQAKLAVR